MTVSPYVLAELSEDVCSASSSDVCVSADYVNYCVAVTSAPGRGYVDYVTPSGTVDGAPDESGYGVADSACSITDDQTTAVSDA